MNAVMITNGFSEKVIFRGKEVILGLKMMLPHNFGSALGIFLKFCTMEESRGTWQLY